MWGFGISHSVKTVWNTDSGDSWTRLNKKHVQMLASCHFVVCLERLKRNPPIPINPAHTSPFSQNVHLTCFIRNSCWATILQNTFWYVSSYFLQCILTHYLSPWYFFVPRQHPEFPHFLWEWATVMKANRCYEKWKGDCVQSTHIFSRFLVAPSTPPLLRDQPSVMGSSWGLWEITKGVNLLRPDLWYRLRCCRRSRWLTCIYSNY